MKKEVLSLMFRLGIICIVVAGLLALVNSVTEPVISRNEARNFDAALSEIMPEAESFEKIEMEFIPSESGVELESIYKAVPGGYVANTVCSEGYGGDIKVMVGINSDMSIKKIKIMSLSETAGLGAKANTDDFMSQYNSLKYGIGVEKNSGGSAENNTVSAISGATITSKAVTKAVNCALEAAKFGGETIE